MLFRVAALQFKPTASLPGRHACQPDRPTSRGPVRSAREWPPDTADNPLPAPAGRTAPQGPASLETETLNLFTHGLLVWAQHREFRAATAELNRYTDRELSDTGLSRSDLTRVAHDEAGRRIVPPPPEPRPAPGGTR